ncbi:MAG: GAF domain-containing protein [Chloroflexi bacterium]|nr:GAF domain-containing protein [Chloroflexota bacterium]
MAKLPAFWFALVLILIVGIVSLGAALVTGQPVIGFAVMVVVAAGASQLLRNMALTRIEKLTRITRSIEETVQSENAIHKIDHLIDSVETDAELRGLARSLRQTLHTMDRHVAQINSLYAISQTIASSTLDYEKTVKAVLSAVQKVVDYDAAEVSVLQQDNHLHVEAWWGKDGFVDTSGRSYKVGSGPTGSIAETKQLVYIPEVSEDVEDLKRTIGYASMNTELIMKTTKLVINSFLGIPLIVQDRLIGTLTLVHHKKNYFTPEDKSQLLKLADQASIAIDNALKIRAREQQLQRQITELRSAIDRERHEKEVTAITESDYFQELKTNADEMRKRSSGNIPVVKPNESEDG